jgi:calcineurin-like phosphoesterase family protein
MDPKDDFLQTLPKHGPLKICLVADTHWQKSKPSLAKNWDKLTKEVDRKEPMIILGDLTWKGHSNYERFKYAVSRLYKKGLRWMSIPGNHDIGNPHFYPKGQRTLQQKKLARYKSYFGADYWTFAWQDWQFVGINTEILGSGYEEEERMLSKLKEPLSQPKLVVFSHRPWFLMTPDEKEVNPKASLPTSIRDRLLKLTRKAKELWVFSGHRHASKEIHRGQHHFIWLPSTGLINAKPTRDHYKAKPIPGYGLLKISPKGELSFSLQSRPDWDLVKK